VAESVPLWIPAMPMREKKRGFTAESVKGFHSGTNISSVRDSCL
jgi:hypothetical protein